MKVLFLSRVDLYNPRGGDTLQMEKTRDFIMKLDPSIEIDIKTEINPPNIKDYDIAHIFNIDWVCESYLQAEYAKKNGLKVVLSAIHHSEDEVKEYEDKARYDIRRVYNFFISSQPQRDTWKNVYRSLFNLHKIYPTIVQLIVGIRNQQKKLLEISDVVLVQTEEEAKSLSKDFKYSNFKYVKVVNGVDADIFLNHDDGDFTRLIKSKNNLDLTSIPIILNVGRIEPRKNQLELINAFIELQKKNELKDYKLVFIGALSNKSFEYTWRFNNLVNSNENIFYLGSQPQSLVASAMNHKGIYVHPSWFETTGLVCLEALLSGMPVVTSSIRLKEYVQSGIEYCRAGDREGLKDAILKSVLSTVDLSRTKENIRENYTWDSAARQTIKVYTELLNS